MNSKIPDRIIEYLFSNHILSLAAFHGGQIWPANLFYSFNAGAACLYVMSSENSLHSKLAMANPHVCGTVSDQQLEISKLKGLQFAGYMTLVSKAEEQTALDHYLESFPVAGTFRDSLWSIRLRTLKFTDNEAGFGKKLSWTDGTLQ